MAVWSKRHWQTVGAAWVGILSLGGQPGAIATVDAYPPITVPQTLPHPHISSTRIACPASLEELTPLLLRDLPGYANRVIARSQNNNRTIDLPPSYILIAGRAELQPLPLEVASSVPSALGQTDSSNVQQVFFTTLERRYGISGFQRLQGYHWLFLTRSPEGWQLVTVVSSAGSYPNGQLILPPQESPEGVIAQTVRLWLRDCRAGDVRSP